jgi:hypothetical protein
LASPVESVKVTLLPSAVLMVLSIMLQFFALAMVPAVLGFDREVVDAEVV